MPDATNQELHERFQRLEAPRLIGPAVLDAMHAGTVAAQTAGRLMLARYVAPHTGVVRDVRVYHAASSGNAAVGLWRISGGQLVKAYDSGSQALTGTNVWRSVGDPAFSVVGGEHFFLGLVIDNATATIARTAIGAVGAANLPPAFDPDFGGLFSGQIDITYPTLPSTITQGDITGSAAGQPGQLIMALCHVPDS